MQSPVKQLQVPWLEDLGLILLLRRMTMYGFLLCIQRYMCVYTYTCVSIHTYLYVQTQFEPFPVLL